MASGSFVGNVYYDGIKPQCSHVNVSSPSFYWDLPLVAKLFTPSVRCPSCSYANDSDFSFCQQCGYKRKVLNNRTSTPLDVDVDVNAIDDRLRQLALFDQATCYSKQKASLQKELENFLSSLPGSISVSTVNHAIFAVSWCIKTRMGKPRFIVTGALI